MTNIISTSAMIRRRAGHHRRVGRGSGAKAQLVPWIAAVALVALAAGACVQQSNTYPVELFKEMHYSQAHRSQEPPRQAPLRRAVAFVPAGGADVVLDVPAQRTRPYDPAVARELYRVNCTVCHGVSGTGDGPAVPHITAPNSFYATQSGGTPYNPPPNLIELRSDRTPEAWYTVLNSGVNVMPRYGAMMSEEEIRDLVEYMFDEQTGLGSQ